MELNAAGLTLIKEFEGFRGRAYRDPVGIWTIGYGHTSAAGAPQVFSGQDISEAQASEILARDVETFSAAVRRAVKVPLNANQFSALVSFTYNVGPGNFLKSSVLRAVNTGEFDHVPVRLNLWVKAGGRNLRGLVRRRKAEGELFATPISEPTQQITFWKRIFTWLWQRN
jgi:lysozyme